MYKSSTLIILAVAFALLFGLVLSYSPCVFSADFIPNDTHSYIDAAEKLYREHSPHRFRTLGYAALLGLPELVVSAPNQNVFITFGILLNVIAWILTLVFVFKTLSLFLNRKTAFAGAIVIMFSIGLLAQTFLVLTESITTLLISIVTYFLMKNERSKDYSYIVFATGFINLMVLFRPGFIYLSILFSLIAISIILWKKLFRSKATLWLVLSLFLLSLQYVAMYRSYGKWTASFVDKIAWYYCLGAQSEAIARGEKFTDVHDERLALWQVDNPLEQARISSEDMKHQLKENTGIVLLRYTGNLIENSYGGSYGIRALNACKPDASSLYKNSVEILFSLTRLQNLLYIALLILSFFLMLKRRVSLSLWFLIVVIGYNFLTSGMAVWQGDRFHIVLYPSILILFAAVIQYFPKTAERLRFKG